MITEDYVSFETAKLLKEKGFDEATFYDYNERGTRWFEEVLVNHNSQGGVACPTLQMAMKWLRERGWFICIIPLAFHCGEKASKFGYNIWADDNLEIDEFDTPVFDTYEDACNAAINYCLKYLN